MSKFLDRIPEYVYKDPFTDIYYMIFRYSYPKDPLPHFHSLYIGLIDNLKQCDYIQGGSGNSAHQSYYFFDTTMKFFMNFKNGTACYTKDDVCIELIEVRLDNKQTVNIPYPDKSKVKKYVDELTIQIKEDINKILCSVELNIDEKNKQIKNLNEYIEQLNNW